jgi:uncharacterized membrane protein (UPF0127 family)
MLVGLLVAAGCGGAPPATSSAPTPTTAAAAAPKPSPAQTVVPTAPPTQATTPVVAAAAPKPSPAGSVGPGAGSPAGQSPPAAASPSAAAPASPAIVVAASPSAAAGASPAGAGGAGPTVPPGSPTVAFARGTVTLTRADGQTRQLQVEVADDDTSRARGLMFRPTMPEEAGMVFIFSQDTDGAFWMQNTLIPLSIAFIGADGRILEIQDMQPLTTDFHKPAQRYRSALEVNQGYFARAGVKAGDRADLRRG